jgi:hypothetical protein
VNQSRGIYPDPALLSVSRHEMRNA